MAYTEDRLARAKRSRRNGQRGNAMLEGALALPPLLMLLFATIDFSIAILVKNTVQSAVREGVRYAVTGQTVSGLGQDQSIRTVVENNSLGFLNSSNGDSLIAINYYNPATLTAVNGVGSNAPGNIVEVQVTGLSWVWMVPYARSSAPLQISATSMDIVEPNATGVPPPR
jgi:Flp pilus assembly protein TadG